MIQIILQQSVQTNICEIITIIDDFADVVPNWTLED